MSEHRSPLLSPTNILALTILTASSLWLGWWFYDRSKFVYVTDARVSATMINVASRIPGWVVEFPLDEGQQVSKGETLVLIDSRETKLKLSEVQARLKTLDAAYEKRELELALARKQVDAAIEEGQANLLAAQASLSEANVAMIQAKKDAERGESLLGRKMISEEEFESRRTDYERAVEAHHRTRAQLATAQAQLATAEANRARIDVLKKELEIARHEQQEVEVEQERLTNQLEDHIIESPIDGVVDETFINTGEYVYPGQRILMLHNPEEVWIKANVKETEIRHLEAGRQVHISVDAFPGSDYLGEITAIGHSATSQFAMLPSPNPSGNFTKVTQRLEVKIDISDVDVELKPGMMVELQIPKQP